MADGDDATGFAAAGVPLQLGAAMLKTDVIIVGGGPAGAACAWRLRRYHVDCIVLDQYSFPRLKSCAGWITPRVLRDLELSPPDYPHGLTTFDGLYISIRGVRFRLPTRQYAIRRVEFDDWLLRRAGVPVHMHTVREITPQGDGYVLDGEYFGKYLVGAGGTYCPVYRSLFREDSPRAKGQLIIAEEEEFSYATSNMNCQLWFLEQRLPGYAWYVPKVNQIVNVGVGAVAEQLKANGDNLKRHWHLLEEKLRRLGLVRDHDFKPIAHSYYLQQNHAGVQKGNAFLTGDAAGLATRDMGEGIGAAIRSGLLAAEAIARGAEYSLKGLAPTLSASYSLWGMIFGYNR